MAKGCVRWFDAKVGHGYIDPVEGGPALFVHRDNLDEAFQGQLDEGLAVEFKIEKGPAGDIARHVTPVVEAPPS